MTKYILKALTVSALLLSNTSMAANLMVLNHNFDSDVIAPNLGYTTSISGWVNSGSGDIGVWAPISNGNVFTNMGEKGQIAYLNEGGRIYQSSKQALTDGETYTLTFDVGRSLTQVNNHFVARFKASGLVLAQTHSDTFTTPVGDWSTESLTFTANSSMPIGEPLVIEFANLATETQHQINLDNIFLTTEGSAPEDPQDNSISNLTIITQDKTLLVPSQYPDINAALRYLDDKQIKVGKTVTIQVTDCTNQVYSESVNVAHPNGDAIHIVGNQLDPSACVLQFNGVSGFVADNGNRIGLVDGFFIAGNNTGSTSGVYATNGAYLKVGESTLISGFGNGVRAFSFATISAEYVESSDNLYSGFTAEHVSNIFASNAKAINNSTGFQAVNGSNILANDSTSSLTSEKGYFAIHGSTLTARNAVVNGSNEFGFYAWFGAHINAVDSTVYNAPKPYVSNWNSGIFK